MPVYEFVCQKCNASFIRVVKGWAESVNAKCDCCSSDDIKRVVTSFTYHRSIEETFEGWAPNLGYYKDPRNIGRRTERRFKGLGLDVPPLIREEIQAAREGELPESLKEL